MENGFSACAYEDVFTLVSDESGCLCCRSLLAGVVQIEAIQELCKLLVVVSSQIQNDFLGMGLLVIALNNNYV